MIKDKLKTISDSDAIEVAKILLVGSTSVMYDFTFDKIVRQSYDNRDGVDAEECVYVYFNAVVKNDLYRPSGWNDKRVMIQLIECDRYHGYPYFNGGSMEVGDKVWKEYYLSNHIEAIEYLQAKNLL